METYQEHDARLSAEHDAALDAHCDTRLTGTDSRDVVRLTRHGDVVALQSQNFHYRATVVLSPEQAITLAVALMKLADAAMSAS